MSMIDFKIGSPYLTNSAKFKLGPDFTFHINDHVWRTKLHHAALISRKVLEMSQIKSTYSNLSFKMDIKYAETYEIFNSLISGTSFSTILDEEKSLEVYTLGMNIGNDELTGQYMQYFDKIQCNTDNLIEYIEKATILNSFDKVIDYIAQNFSKIDESLLIDALIHLNFNNTETIFKNQNLSYQSEDYLVKIILELSRKSFEYIYMLKYVSVEFCSIETILDLIDHFEKSYRIRDCQDIINCFKRLLQEHDNLEFKSSRTGNKSQLIGRDKYNELKDEYNTLQHNYKVFSIEMLTLLPKTKENFSKIYKILENSYNEGLYNVISYAVDNGYCNVEDEAGNNAIIYASKQNNFELCRKLHELGANPDVKCKWNNTVLIWFSIKDNLEAIQYFANFVDYNAVNNTKGSPLYYASRDNHIDIVKYLCLLPKINIEIVNDDGKTPLSVAASDEVRNILISHGASK